MSKDTTSYSIKPSFKKKKGGSKKKKDLIFQPEEIVGFPVTLGFLIINYFIFLVRTSIKTGGRNKMYLELYPLFQDGCSNLSGITRRRVATG